MRRFEINVSIGPCTDAEADTLAGEIGDYCARRFGAIITLKGEGDSVPRLATLLIADDRAVHRDPREATRRER